jgi:cytochrome bd ubiquinol oxidase subunit II
MTVADVVLAAMWIGLTAYVLFGGADFGAGLWDLLAGGAERGDPQRRLIEHSIGPVWEANHVWLIFVLVVLWTAFPPAFAAVASTLYIPLTLAAFGMIARGSAFAFRKPMSSLGWQRAFGGVFGFSSVATPFFLGAIAGGIASGRVPSGIAAGNVVTSWLNPTSLLGGVLSVGACAYIAAVFLCGDGRREGEHRVAEDLRIRGLVTALVLGAVALAGIEVLRRDAPALFDGLTGRGLPLIVLSAVAGLASILLLIRRSYTTARLTASLAVTAVIWGWGAGQYPYLLLPDLTVEEAAASTTTLVSLIVVIAVGAVVLVPSLVYLYVLFQRGGYDDDHDEVAPTAELSPAAAAGVRTTGVALTRPPPPVLIGGVLAVAGLLWGLFLRLRRRNRR